MSCTDRIRILDTQLLKTPDYQTFVAGIQVLNLGWINNC